MRPSNTFRGAALALLVAGTGAGAQQVGVEAPGGDEGLAVGELGAVRLRYGLAFRSGLQNDSGPGLSYSGMTPNDVALSGWLFGRGYLGGALSLQREGFGLFDGTDRVTGGALLRAHAGPAGRIRFGPLRVELLAGYQLAQLPTFGTTVSPALSAATRHSALLASRVLVDAGPVQLEARGELPLALSTSDGKGGAARSSGYAAGASLAVPFLRDQSLGYAAVLDFQRVADGLTDGEGAVSSQTVNRVGLAFEVRWQAPSRVAPRPTVGSLLVTVIDGKTGQELPGATVTLVAAGEERSVGTAAPGGVRVGGLAPGQVVARASAAGYLPAEAGGEVMAGGELKLTLRARPEPPKVGGLVITVADRLSGAPLTGAVVSVRGSEYVTNQKGTVSLVDQPPGPVAVKVKVKGYLPGEEVAAVVAGRSSEVPVALSPEEKRVPATITGIVRSTRGGQPIAAELELPQAKLNTRASAKGEFSFKVPGGTYSVSISAPGFISQVKTVTVKDGDQAIFNVDLHPQQR